MTISAARAAGDQTAPSPVTVRMGDPAPQRTAPVTVHPDTEDPCAREVRFSIDVLEDAKQIDNAVFVALEIQSHRFLSCFSSCLAQGKSQKKYSQPRSQGSAVQSVAFCFFWPSTVLRGHR